MPSALRQVVIMSIGLACAVVGVVALCIPYRSDARMWACRIGMTGALLLYAPVTEITIGLMNCELVQLSLRLVSALDGHAGDAAPSSATAASQLSTWNLLANDPHFVCFEGQHASAGILAELVFAVYVCAFPVILLAWIWRSIREARKLQAATSSKDLSAPLSLDPAIAPFVVDPGYALRFWYWRFLDLFVIFILAINQGLQPRPQTANLIVRPSGGFAHVLAHVH